MRPIHGVLFAALFVGCSSSEPTPPAPLVEKAEGSVSDLPCGANCGGGRKQSELCYQTCLDASGDQGKACSMGECGSGCFPGFHCDSTTGECRRAQAIHGTCGISLLAPVVVVCAEGLSCVDGVCVEAKKSFNDPCTSSSECEGNASGASATMACRSGRCRPSCTSDSSCPCDPAGGTKCDNGVCKECAGAGSNPNDCSSTWSCCNGTLCESGGVVQKCKEPPGGPCNPSDPTPLFPCASDASCDPITAKCKCNKSEPTACSSSSDCCLGDSCVSGTCRHPTGAPCAVSAACKDADKCDGGVCTPVTGCNSAAGGACSTPHVASGCCSGLSCQSGTCRKPDNDSCTSDAECADNSKCMVSGYPPPPTPTCIALGCGVQYSICSGSGPVPHSIPPCCSGFTCVPWGASPTGYGCF
jgi:hypothetical protein